MKKGLLRGPTSARKGKIEMADGGTLFLDEVGAINAKMQVDLLRVLETHEVFRVGSDRPRKVDFRVVCATNDDLSQAIREGRFREDFYYRINVFTIELPPLRARRGDIPALAQHFLDRFSRQMDSRITEISPEAMEVLTGYDWPGNVRELSNAIERAMVVGRPPAIEPCDLPVRRGQRGRRRCNRWRRLRSSTLPPCWRAREAISPAPQKSSRSIGSRSITRSKSTA